jgi:hypothetical protein
MPRGVGYGKIEMIFSGNDFLCFCRGSWGKRVVERGFLMVNVRWIVVISW